MGTNNPSASVTVNVPTGSSFAVNHTFRPDRYAMMYHPGHRVPRPHHHTAPFASWAFLSNSSPSFWLIAL